MTAKTTKSAIKLTSALLIAMCFKNEISAQNALPSTGLVGINTTTPIQPLHVAGHILVADEKWVPPASSHPAFIRAVPGFSSATNTSYTWWYDDQTGIFHPEQGAIGFSTGGKESFRVHSNGNVGIGTTNPQAVLHTSVKDGSIQLRLERTNSDPGYCDLGGYGGDFMVWAGGYDKNQKFAIKAANGNVGIGTLTPSQKLHVQDGSVLISGDVNGFGGPTLLFGESNGNPNTWAIQNNKEGLNFWRPYNGQNNSGNYFLFMDHNTGNVGIGTNKAVAQLTVRGKVLIGDPNTVKTPDGYQLFVQFGILTEKLKVTNVLSTDWADYVFKPDYKLMDLKNVSSYIEKNGHLPGVPSAEEVATNGVDLVKMDAKLLEKIEELTLHVIKLSEQNTTLNERVKELEGTKK